MENASSYAWLLLTVVLFVAAHIVTHDDTEPLHSPLPSPAWGTDTNLLREMRAARTSPQEG